MCVEGRGGGCVSLMSMNFVTISMHLFCAVFFICDECTISRVSDSSHHGFPLYII